MRQLPPWVAVLPCKAVLEGQHVSILRERGSQMPQGRGSAWDSHSACHMPNLDHAKRLLAACSSGCRYRCVGDTQSLLMH